MSGPTPEEILARVNGAIEAHGEDWLGRAVDRAGELADAHLPAGPERDLATAALSAVDDHKGALVALGQDGLGRVLSTLALGGPSASRAARLIYLARSSSFEERRQDSHASTEAARQAREAREAAASEVLGALEALGQQALRILLPLLLSALAA